MALLTPRVQSAAAYGLKPFCREARGLIRPCCGRGACDATDVDQPSIDDAGTFGGSCNDADLLIRFAINGPARVVSDCVLAW